MPRTPWHTGGPADSYALSPKEAARCPLCALRVSTVQDRAALPPFPRLQHDVNAISQASHGLLHMPSLRSVWPYYTEMASHERVRTPAAANGMRRNLPQEDR